MSSLIVFVKYPEPGKVKTRLGADVGSKLAAELYRLFLRQTFELLRQSVADRVYVAYEPEELGHEFTNIIPEEFERFPQTGDDLGERLHNAFGYVFEQSGHKKAIAVGSDSPTLPRVYLDQAVSDLDYFDLVLGPAEDGGYYLIGLKEPCEDLFQDVHWSSSSVLKTTVAQASQIELAYHLLPPWYDVDDLQTLKRAARDDSSGRIAALLEERSDILSI
ncbi:DUF2064 domain-containing protein [candidate division KSB1 bacterium]|nr:DUF2064 domain-containing protein [candidate division KSB1 bacterium]